MIVPQEARTSHADKQLFLFHDASHLFCEWKSALEAPITYTSLNELSAIASRGMLLLNQELVQWARELPQVHAFILKPITREAHPEWLQELLRGPWSPEKSHAYASPVAEMLWRFHWVTKLILSQALLYTNAILLDKDPSLSVSNPVADAQRDIEISLLSASDHLSESCLSPLINASSKAQTSLAIDDVPSRDGYLMLQVLPSLAFAFRQASGTYTSLDLGGRAGWVKTMKNFLSRRLGFSKAGVELEYAHGVEFPVQMWGIQRLDAQIAGLDLADPASLAPPSVRTSSC